MKDRKHPDFESAISSLRIIQYRGTIHATKENGKGSILLQHTIDELKRTVMKNYSILIVEDDRDIRQLLADYFTKKNFDVTVKDNLPLNELANYPDLILMDVSLPGVSGKSICYMLKHNISTAHIPVIMMSASPMAKVECLLAGANEFIEKPFTLFEIGNKVMDILLMR